MSGSEVPLLLSMLHENIALRKCLLKLQKQQMGVSAACDSEVEEPTSDSEVEESILGECPESKSTGKRKREACHDELSVPSQLQELHAETVITRRCLIDAGLMTAKDFRIQMDIVRHQHQFDSVRRAHAFAASVSLAQVWGESDVAWLISSFQGLPAVNAMMLAAPRLREPLQNIQISVTRAWKQVPEMLNPTRNARALLMGGCMYVYTISPQHLRMQCYDPVTGVWRSLPKLKYEEPFTARNRGKVENRVRVTANIVALRGMLYVCNAIGWSGLAGCPSYPSGERFNPIKEQWEKLPRQQNNCRRAAVAATKSHVYVCGGYDFPEASSFMERFDPAKNCWETMPSMLQARAEHSLIVFRNDLIVVGGVCRTTKRAPCRVHGDSRCDYCSPCYYEDTLSSTELFDTKALVWKQLPSMGEPRALSSTVVQGSQLYVCGGMVRAEAGQRPLMSVECLNATAALGHDRRRLTGKAAAPGRSWITVSPLMQPRVDGVATVLKGRVYISGGFTFETTDQQNDLGNESRNFLQTIEFWEPNVGQILRQWRELPSLQGLPCQAAVAASCGHLYVFGGCVDGNDVRTINRYDVEGQKWVSLARDSDADIQTPGPFW